MPETAENVAEDFDINRADQDAFALRSQSKAGAAMASGRLSVVRVFRRAEAVS